jgi:hypothetical protein
MNRLLLHLTIPALVAAGAVWSALRFEAFTLSTLAVYAVFGFLYYSAPHLLWAFVAALSKPSRAVYHAGFIAANIALAAIVWVSFTGAHDPSGLPLQWVAYWPGALVLQALFVAVTAALRRGTARVGA